MRTLLHRLGTTIVVVATLIGAARPATAAPNGFVWTDLAATDVDHKLHRVIVGDGDTIADSIGGLSCRRNQDPSNDFYMYFKLDDDVALNGNRQLATISFHYFDAPGTTFFIQYDATSGVYQSTPSFTTQGTNTWQVYTITVKNAYFGNRQNNGADFRVAVVPGPLFDIDLAYVAFPASLKALHVAPRQGVQPNWTAAPFRDMCLNPTQWSTGSGRANYFGIADHIMGDFLSDADLSSCFTALKNRGTRLMIEVPARKEWCTTGAACFADSNSRFFQRFVRLGANLDILAMDEPFFATRHFVLGSDTSAVNETAEYMRQARLAYPNTIIFSIEPYPAIDSTWLNWWQMNLARRCAAVGTPMPQAFILDHDWHASGWTSSQIAFLHNSSNATGYMFGVLFGATQPNNGTTDKSWYDGVMTQAATYSQAGLHFELLSINNFQNVPVLILPESAQWSFALSVRDFINNWLSKL